MTRLTITMEEDLFEILRNRAKYNCRSMAKEIVFLLESALAVESEGNLQIIRTLFHAQGGLDAIQVPGSNSAKP